MSFQTQWPRLRQAFSHTADQLFLNHAAISPLPLPAVVAIQAYAQDRHRDCIENYEPLMERIARLRAHLAHYLNAQPTELAFVSNTSQGLSILAHDFPWQAGDRILLNTLEFPSNVYPFLNLQSRGVHVDFVDHRDYYLPLEDIIAALTPQTRVLSISHVQFLTGQRHDLATLGKVCAEWDIVFCVDGIQSLGATQIDVKACQIDFLAAGGQKWMMGLQGQAFVYLSESLQKRLHSPATVGWLSVEDAWELLDYRLSPRQDAARYEIATPNGIGLTALLAAREFLDSFDAQGWTEHVLALTTALWQGFAERGYTPVTPVDPQERLGIVTVPCVDAEARQQALKAQNIYISAREQRFLRVSPHGYNSLEEIAAFFKAFDSL